MYLHLTLFLLQHLLHYFYGISNPLFMHPASGLSFGTLFEVLLYLPSPRASLGYTQQATHEMVKMDETSSDHLSSLLMHLQGLQHSAESLLMLPFGDNADFECIASTVPQGLQRRSTERTELMMRNAVAKLNVDSDAAWCRDADSRLPSLPSQPPILRVPSEQGPPSRPRLNVVRSSSSVSLPQRSAPSSEPCKLVRWVDETPGAAARRQAERQESSDTVHGKGMRSIMSRRHPSSVVHV